MKRLIVKFNLLNQCKLLWKMRMYNISMDSMIDELESRIGNKCPSRSYLNHLMLKNQLEPFLYQNIASIIREYEYELSQEEKRRSKKDVKKDLNEYGSTGVPSPCRTEDRTQRYSNL